MTNNNIKSKAEKGSYKGGIVKFFTITKPSVIEWRNNSYIYYTGRRYSSLVDGERAGDYYNNSITKELGTNTARIDHAKDNDVYCFTPTITRYYTLSSTSGNSANINCIVYDAVGTHYKSDNKEAVKTESNERRSFYRMMFILDLFPDIDVELSTKIYNELSDDERKAQDCTRQYIGYKKINKDQTEALLKLKKDSKDTGIGYSWMPYAEFRLLGCIEPLKKGLL